MGSFGCDMGDPVRIVLNNATNTDSVFGEKLCVTVPRSRSWRTAPRYIEVVDRGRGDLAQTRRARQIIGHDNKQDAPGFQTRHDRVARRDHRPAAAFPLAVRDVRPLAGVIVGVIAAELGWSVSYCKGVLHVWKQRKAYCDAVLTYDLRRGLDGLPTEALVGPDARRMAQAQLAALAASRQKREARKAAGSAKAARVNATRVSPPAPERRRPILTLTSLRDGGL